MAIKMAQDYRGRTYPDAYHRVWKTAFHRSTNLLEAVVGVWMNADDAKKVTQRVPLPDVKKVGKTGQQIIELEAQQPMVEAYPDPLFTYTVSGVPYVPGQDHVDTIYQNMMQRPEVEVKGTAVLE